MEVIPPGLRTDDLLEDLQYVLRVRIWGPSKIRFEFAHFSDTELATGLCACPQVTAPPLTELIHKVAHVRSKGEEISRVWKD